MYAHSCFPCLPCYRFCWLFTSHSLVSESLLLITQFHPLKFLPLHPGRTNLTGRRDQALMGSLPYLLLIPSPSTSGIVPLHPHFVRFADLALVPPHLPLLPRPGAPYLLYIYVVSTGASSLWGT